MSSEALKTPPPPAASIPDGRRSNRVRSSARPSSLSGVLSARGPDSGGRTRASGVTSKAERLPRHVEKSRVLSQEYPGRRPRRLRQFNNLRHDRRAAVEVAERHTDLRKVGRLHGQVPGRTRVTAAGERLVCRRIVDLLTVSHGTDLGYPVHLSGSVRQVLADSHSGNARRGQPERPTYLFLGLGLQVPQVEVAGTAVHVEKSTGSRAGPRAGCVGAAEREAAECDGPQPMECSTVRKRVHRGWPAKRGSTIPTADHTARAAHSASIRPTA